MNLLITSASVELGRYLSNGNEGSFFWCSCTVPHDFVGTLTPRWMVPQEGLIMSVLWPPGYCWLRRTSNDGYTFKRQHRCYRGERHIFFSQPVRERRALPTSSRAAHRRKSDAVNVLTINLRPANCNLLLLYRRWDRGS